MDHCHSSLGGEISNPELPNPITTILASISSSPSLYPHQSLNSDHVPLLRKLDQLSALAKPSFRSPNNSVIPPIRLLHPRPPPQHIAALTCSLPPITISIFPSWLHIAPSTPYIVCLSQLPHSRLQQASISPSQSSAYPPPRRSRPSVTAVHPAHPSLNTPWPPNPTPATPHIVSVILTRAR
ncbi:hypothetical protein JAAARDRAFT_341123 [Jaapia argillacea MUCL 33604]|uniref:Uncharacterized protein n=1 Tax=Jaapia argillacea MUCL 33604 TaxID=933084 RepID=A0A067PJX4_9AGAM|nr:hypothetical protein JAAARDRAFT_341123 [Jaapia argillacea MUCL 33604]